MNQMPIARKAVSVPEAAKMIGLSVNRVYQLVKCGEIPAKHIGNRWLISIKKLEEWLEGGDDDYEG